MCAGYLAMYAGNLAMCASYLAMSAGYLAMCAVYLAMWESKEMKWQILLQKLLYNYLCHPTKYPTPTLSAIYLNSYKTDFNQNGMLP